VGIVDWKRKNENPVIIQFQKLISGTLYGVIEKYVTRDGIDYGFVKISLDRRSTEFLWQLKTGDAFLVYDQDKETANIISKRQISGGSESMGVIQIVYILYFILK
jgi:uncharacterized protein YheU (UPF0270 family)